MNTKNNKTPTAPQERRYPDSIETSDGYFVRLSSLRPDQTIRITKKRIPVKASDIPMTAVLTTCGLVVRGIAFEEGDVIFCEQHGVDERVEEVLS